MALRPVVKLRPVRRGGSINQWVVWCLTDGCEFTEVDPTKTYAQEMQRRHARDHRSGRIGGRE